MSNIIKINIERNKLQMIKYTICSKNNIYQFFFHNVLIYDITLSNLLCNYLILNYY